MVIMRIKLTAVEYELMLIIWGLGQASVRQVLEHLPKNRRLAYTSVATILRILETKKVLRSVTSGRSHIFVPKVSKEAFIKDTTSTFISDLFSGNSLAFVAYLLKDEKITQNEIEEIKKLIQKKEREVKCYD